jgi:hypothetical protein
VASMSPQRVVRFGIAGMEGSILGGVRANYVDLGQISVAIAGVSCDKLIVHENLLTIEAEIAAKLIPGRSILDRDRDTS